MTIEIWLAYITTVLILMSTPGPSQLLMLSNSIGSGFKRSLATAAGDLTANVLQMTVAALGLVTLIQNSQTFFVIIKWAGVLYLIYLGITQFLKKASSHQQAQQEQRSFSSLYWQGFVTSAANPKAVIFFAALFPQFINPAVPVGNQFLILSITYVLIDAVFLVAYGSSASWIARRLEKRWGQLMNKVTGVLLIVAALLLGAKDVRTK